MDAESSLRGACNENSDSSFDEEEFFDLHYKTYSTTKKSFHTLKAIMVMKSLQVMKGYHKLKIILRK